MIVRTLTGVVKDGVIVPDVPLRDGDYVEISVPTAPREIVERVRKRQQEREGRAAASGGCTVGPDVLEFLRYHAAEGAFSRLPPLLDACFPDRLALSFDLAEDWDAHGWIRVECRIVLPPDLSREVVQNQERHFYKELREVVPPPTNMLFSFGIAQE